MMQQQVEQYLGTSEVTIGIALWIAVWGLTEIFKRMYRSSFNDRGSVAPRVFAVGLGFLLGAAAWPDDGVLPWWLAGIAIGVANVIVYRIVIKILDIKYPGIAGALSGREQ